MGPSCEVLLENDDLATLIAIDAVLDKYADRLERTRKGRVWQLWIDGHPILASVKGPPPSLGLSAGCNSKEDYALLGRLAGAVETAIGGIASEPEK
jgi:hypothetical protein